jgi:hypothetical protein
LPQIEIAKMFLFSYQILQTVLDAQDLMEMFYYLAIGTRSFLKRIICLVIPIQLDISKAYQLRRHLNKRPKFRLNIAILKGMSLLLAIH